MTQAQVIEFIREWIITNGNELITADVLRPILEAMVNQSNDKMGELPNLQTTYKDDLVGAINEINGLLSDTGIQVWNGTANPNVTPPVGFEIADFYYQDNGTVQKLFQYNGATWVDIDQNLTPEIFKTYATIAAMIADQAGQEVQKIYQVTDASGDSRLKFAPTETYKIAFYRYKGGVGAITQRYEIVSAPNHINNAVVNTYSQQSIAGRKTFSDTLEVYKASYPKIDVRSTNNIIAYGDSSIVSRIGGFQTGTITFSASGDTLFSSINQSPPNNVRTLLTIKNVDALSGERSLAITGRAHYVVSLPSLIPLLQDEDLVPKKYVDEQILTGDNDNIKETVVTGGGTMISIPAPTTFLKFTNQTTPVILAGFANPVDGKEITIWNQTLQSMDILHESPIATANERISVLGEQDVSLPVDGKALFRYSSDASRWTMVDIFGAGTVSTNHVANKAITKAKMEDMPKGTILGRKNTTNGVPENLTKTDVLTLINVQDGANKNVKSDWTATTGDSEVLNKPQQTNFNIYNQNKTNKRVISTTTKSSIITATVGSKNIPSYNKDDSFIGKVRGFFNPSGAARTVQIFFSIGNREGSVSVNVASSAVAVPFYIDYGIDFPIARESSITGIIIIGNDRVAIDLDFTTITGLNFDMNTTLNGGTLTVNSSYLHRNYNS